jgi:ferredoxin
MEGNRAKVVDRGACMECGACQRNCAFGAISVESGVGCAAAIIASWFNKGEVACGPSDGPATDAGRGDGSKGTCC